MSDQENHNYCTGKFIELANELKNSGYDTKLISAAMMASSGIYATYISAGNEGYLEHSGVEKVVDIYRTNLEHIQRRKQDEIKQKQQEQADFGE